MPFAFVLPTTSKLDFTSSLHSSIHPSFPLKATTYRNILRNVLKKHKRLSLPSRDDHLTTVCAVLDDYLPYLLALAAGISGKSVRGEDLGLTLKKEIEVDWRSTLTATGTGLEPSRVKGRGVDYEVCFVLNALGLLHALQARAQLLALYGAATPTEEQRIQIITAATKHFLHANSIHGYLAGRMTETDASLAVIETLSQTQGALEALALGEATLLAVLRDDPYPAVVAQDRNKNDKDWMIKPPEIPKVRARLFARLCLAAAEHASKAEAMLSASGRVDESLIKYVTDLRKTSRAKACRFFGIDTELGGETGTAIAWLVGGKGQLGFGGLKDDESKMKGIAKFKKDWTERREDKRVGKGADWGSDAGKLEEFRIIEMLEQKWNKMNDMVRPLSLGSCIQKSWPDDKVDQHSIGTSVQSPCSQYAFR